MSRRIVYLALAAATVIATPAAAAPQSQARTGKHASYPRAFPALGPIAGPVATTSAPHAKRAGDTTIIVETWPSLDPAWQLCQIDGRGDRSYFCGPYSYHPFGIYGYRPYGTYRAHRATTASGVAPGARIIRVESD
jgi:hypothetical protein